jgi:hypothetical protein
MLRLATLRSLLIIGVVVFVVVGLSLKLIVGLPTWAAIAIPGFVIGGVEGIAERARS